MKQLILGQIPDNFDPNIHIPIHIGCFSEKEHIYPNFMELDWQMPYNFEKLVEIDLSLRNYACFLCAELGKKIEKKQNLPEHLARFWEIVLFPAISMFVQTVWVAEQFVFDAIQKYGNEKMQVLLYQAEYQFLDTEEIAFAIRKTDFNAWVFSQILEKNMPKQWTFSHQKIDPASKQNSTSTPNFRKKLEIIFYNFLGKHGRYKLVYGFSLLESALMGLLLRLKPAKKNYVRIEKQAVSKPTQIDFSLDMLEFVEKLLPKCTNSIQKADFYGNFVSGKLNLGTSSLLFDEDYKIKIAYAYEKGERLIGAQHGGHCYGSEQLMQFWGYVEYMHDAFLTWGYDQQANMQSNFVPMPSPLLSKMANKHKQENEKIILVGTLMTFHKTLISNFYAPEKYRKNKVTFIENIDSSLQKDFMYRPYFVDDDSIQDKKFYQKRFEWLQIHQGNFHQDLLKCKLLVLDHLGTTFNIALAANAPIICFYHKDMIVVCEEAKPYFNKLEEAGILFYDPIKAIEQVNKITKEGVQKWWQQPDVQEAKNYWRDRFAITSENWREKWFKFVWKF